MKKLYIFTLEPLEQRYTKQWYSYFKTEFGKYFKVIYIDGEKTSDKIKKGKFLDINKTNIWKSQQIEKVSKLFNTGKIKDGDRFFFADAWHYGITAVKYMSQLNDIKTKLYGYFHAGSYDPNDFVAQKGLNKWAIYNELGWLRALDCSFVATNFHKQLLIETFNGHIAYKKIQVVGFPMDWENEIATKIDMSAMVQKEDLIVFPHRLDKEKQPEVFDKLKKRFPKYNFVKTLKVTKNKQEYYELIRKAKIIFSANLQETFGIGTVEAMMLGAIPVVPNRLTYIEMYYLMFRYKTEKDMFKKIEYYIENYNEKRVQTMLLKNVNRIRTESLESIKKMVGVMLK